MAQYRADLDVAALKCNLKHVVIEEFKNFLKILERGQMPDQEIILEQIGAINDSDSIFILQYYINNGQYDINSQSTYMF